MSVRSFVLRPDEREPALQVLGTEVTVLASNEATQNYGITFQRGDEGTGPPPHNHAWDESFYVLAGVVEFHCDGKKHSCEKGTLVHVPGGTVHGFQYGEGGGEMIEITGSQASAIKMFTAVANEIPPGPPDVSGLLRVFKENGVSIAE